MLHTHIFIVIDYMGKGEEKRKHFLIVESQPVNVKGMTESENHYLATNVVTVDSGKNHQ